MKRKIKLNICKRILSILLCILIMINLSISKYTYVYAEDLNNYNPLFIPIYSFVTAVAVGSGIIAKNSSEAMNAASQLINNAVTNIKNAEILKKEQDVTYESPFKVINENGQVEDISPSNKNGKWVSLGGGSIANSDVWANKSAVSTAMEEINKLNGYNSMVSDVGTVNSSDLIAQSSASNIALQLAKISNSAVTQFDNFLHSNFWENNSITPDDCFFQVNVNVPNIISNNPIYPSMYLWVYKKNDNITKLLLSGNPFGYNTYSNEYGSLSYYFGTTTNTFCKFVNDDNVTVNTQRCSVEIYSRTAEQNYSQYAKSWSNADGYIVTNGNISTKYNYAFAGYKWAYEVPWQLTNNVYDVSQTFEVNFPAWLEDTISILNQNVASVRLGIQDLTDVWQNTQTQIQTAESPAKVIYELINNYENPEDIEDDSYKPVVPDLPGPGGNDNPGENPGGTEEPIPDDNYLSEFLLPTTITEKFPFSIPFDIVRCLRLFDVNTRKAPKWEYDLRYGAQTSHIVIDLSIFDDLASFIRPLEFIAFLVGLAYATRYLIRG